MLFENLWTTIIANEFPEYKVLNFGIPGAASDTVARIGVNTLRSLTSQVHAVLALWPAPHRREYASKSFTGLVYKLPLLAPTPTQDMLPFENYWEMIDWKANSYNFCKNQLLLSTSSNTNNSEYFDLQINTNDKQISDDFILGAAFGVNTQRAIANYFIKLLRKQPSYFDQTKMQV
jgi:hypothetical protein